MSRFRLYLRTGLVAIGVLFGPDLLFGSVAGTLRLIREGRDDQMAVIAPAALAMIACALWGFVAGHWYVRWWFMAIAAVWNTWAAFDMFARPGTWWTKTAGLIWLAWSWRFTSLVFRDRAFK